MFTELLLGLPKAIIRDAQKLVLEKFLNQPTFWSKISTNYQKLCQQFSKPRAVGPFNGLIFPLTLNLSLSYGTQNASS